MQTYSLKGEEIVISGISGRFPEANNVEEFWHKLITGQELYSCNDRRWPVGYMGLPSFSGKVSGEVKCDAEFFKLHKDECKLLDPQYRMALEVVYEAIYDA
ncbi:fatty acid synthase-like protein, partial [Dinothrombium tinctorium]